MSAWSRSCSAGLRHPTIDIFGLTIPREAKPESTDELALVECRNEESAL